MAVYGGFAGTETAVSQRNWQTNKSILSGDIDNNDSQTPVLTDLKTVTGNTTNSYHLVNNSGIDRTAILDGFTITAGYSNGSVSLYDTGAGMNNNNSSPSLANLTFSGNYAPDTGSFSNAGGGMYNKNSSPDLFNVIFIANAAGYGGGLYNFGGAPLLSNVTFMNNFATEGGGVDNGASWLTMSSVTFIGNTASDRGGAIRSISYDLKLFNVAFIGNTAAQIGGGLYNLVCSATTLTNVIFDGNTAVYGAGIFNYDCDPGILNATFSGNSATDSGAAIYNSSSYPVVVNSLLWGNTSPGGAQIFNANSSVPLLSYDDIQNSGGSGAGWNAALGTDNGHNLDLAPSFVDADGVDGIIGTGDDNLRLRADSNLVDMGNNSALPAGLSVDFDDNARILGAAVDIGAYETPICYPLSFSHNSGGDDPTPNPIQSSACSGSHTYVPGEHIELTAHPSTGFDVGGWTGTDQDASTALTNSLSMPESARTVTVNYIPHCYPLTLQHSGTGSNPTASPPNSSGCSVGNYIAGQSITLTAAPAAGYHLDQWAGTDSSSSNHLSMPASAWTATAYYVVNPPTCYLLTLQHSGSGSDPTASPLNSSGCSQGYYLAGASITLSPHPAAGYHLDHWAGTDSSSSNHLSMPAGTRTATAYYVADSSTCHLLTLLHSGSGSDPTASPANSSGCSAGYYTAGESITLREQPAPGYHLSSWSETDSITSNHLTMPAYDWSVIAYYEVNPPTCYPLTLNYSGAGSNPTASLANSPGCSNGFYTAGESLTLTAHPAEGYYLHHWGGTDNPYNNHLTMPGGSWTVTALYLLDQFSNQVFLPMIRR